MEKKKPIYPALDEGTYAEDVERGIAEAEKKAAEIERWAKRDRDMALIGDMAHLVSQGAAMHGGAWKIGQTQNESAKGNERLRVLREKNAAQTAAFAKERAALREAKRKEQNAQKLAQYNAEVEAYKREQAQANTLARLEEQERHNRAMEQIQTDREDRLEKQGGSGAGGAANFLKVTMPDGTVKNFSKKELGDNWANNAYETAVAAGMPRAMKYKINPETGMPEPYEDTSLAGRMAHMEAWSAENANNIQAAYAELPSGYRVQKEIKLYDEDDMGKPVLRIDAEGMPVTRLVENTKPTLGEMRQAIEEYNARELKKAGTAAPAKKANPMSGGKKTNPMN